jgi:nitrite reductase/ring-hydroxylating ferredoxin subunit
MAVSRWHDLGPMDDFTRQPITPVTIEKLRLAITWVNGEFGAISGVCNHAGGPLGEGRMERDYVVCPWHNWKYHHTLTDRGFSQHSRRFV